MVVTLAFSGSAFPGNEVRRVEQYCEGLKASACKTGSASLKLQVQGALISVFCSAPVFGKGHRT